MLPSPPKSLGRLGDVLISSLAAVKGQPNSLGLTGKKSVVVILIDGLGTENLKGAGAHASFLNSQKSLPASSFFPATTATSLVSLATGAHPCDTGFVGYQVLDLGNARSMNLLSGWQSEAEARDYQTVLTVSETCLEEGIEFHTISPKAYEQSGFTAATMRASKFHGANAIADRFRIASELLANPEQKIVYLYVPELDQIAHAQGCESNSWLSKLEDLDSLIRIFAQNLPKSAGLVVTADHGVLDVPQRNHIYLDEVIPTEDLSFVGGDTRGLFIYLKDQEKLVDTLALLESKYSDTCYVCVPEDLIASGYWKPTTRLSQVQPDILLIARKVVALYHRGFAKKMSLAMVGHHGSFSNTEMSIPLITIGF